MSLAADSFDAEARGLVGNYAPHPPAHAWAAIAAQLPPEPRGRRAAGWWWLAGGALLVALLMLYAMQPQAAQLEHAARPALAPVQQAFAPVPVAAEQELLDDPHQALATPSPLAETELPAQKARLRLPPPADATPTVQRQPMETALAVSPTLAAPIVAVALPSLELLSQAELSTLPSSADELQDARLIPCPDFNNRGSWSLGLRVFAGPGRTNREFSASDNDLPLYSALRDSVEERQMSVHAGLRFEGVHSNGLFLRAGVDYQMYRSRLRLIGNSMRSFNLVDVTDPISGNVLRTDTVYSSTVTESLRYNRHQTLALSAGLGFRKTFGRVSPYLLAEAGYEFLLKTRGQLIDPAGALVNLENTNQAWVEERPGLHYGGVVGIDFALTNHLEVGVSGHYKRLGGLRGQSDPLAAEYTSMFGAANVRWHF